MRAVVITDTTNRSVSIEELSDPDPKEGEIVVDVKACGVNFTDFLSLDGKYQNNPKPPFTPGKDAAGVDSAVGPGVADHSIGDRVIAHVIHGAMVGLASVSLAKALGAKTVLAGLTTPSKAGPVSAAGADSIIDLSGDDLKDNMRSQIMAATDRHGVDLAFDLVGGEVFDATLRAIANEGRVVVSGFTSGTIPAVRTNYLLLKNISVVGSTINYYIKQGSPLVGEAQAALFELLLEGKVGPNIMQRLPFTQYLDGIKMLEERKIIGKSVLLMD